MNRTYICMLLMLSVVSLYSADKNIQQLSDIKTCPHIIVNEGTAAVHTDIYTKLLNISRTLQEQVNDSDKHVPLPNKPYYPVNRNIELLPHIVNFISADNSETYLRTLSLIELVNLYQEADFWAVDTNILDTIRNSIISQLRNKNVLSQLLSSKENLAHFINTCNPVTLDTLTQALHSCNSNMLWYTAQTLIGHTSGINSVAVHTDGTLFSCSDDCCTIGVWKKDTQGTYHCIQTLFGHTLWINKVAVHPDGTLFSASRDSTIRVWKPDAQGIYKCVQTLTGHRREILTMAVHTDGTLFSGSNDYTIRAWKQDTQGKYKCVQTLIGHTDWVNTLAVHTDGTLFSGSNDCIICVWKKDSQGSYHCIQTLTDHTNLIHTVAVHTDGTLFLGSFDGKIRVWKKDAQDKYYSVQTLTGHTDLIRKVAVHTDGTLFSGSRDATIRVWKTLDEHLSLEQHLFLHWLYTMYQLNGNTQINTLPTYMVDTYHTLPQSIKDHIVQWYKPEHI